MPVPHVLLIGLPGSGKSTVARAVAARIGCDSVELDAEIERLAGAPVPHIFRNVGEAGFRRFEVEATRGLLSRTSPGIVSTGGGWIANARARKVVPRDWQAIYLRMSPAVAADRLAQQARERPLLAEASGSAQELKARLEQLARERVRLYERAGTTIDTDPLTLPQVIDRTAELASALLFGERTR
jgi:shikimate kinase